MNKEHTTNYTWYYWTGKKESDKVDREKMFEALERTSVNKKGHKCTRTRNSK